MIVSGHRERMREPGLIIFDCDGVLVDSEIIACRIDAECLNEIGIAISVDEIATRYIGVSAAAIFADVETRFARKLPADFGDTLSTRLVEAFTAELKAVPGIEDALDRISYATCVASSSDPARIERSLLLTGLLPRFHARLFSAKSVACGKPAPDLFLLAAERMDTDPRDCLVVEDSIPGVEAGVAAGMTVIGFTGGSHCPPGHDAALRKAGAVTVCSRAADLPDAILPR